MPVHRGDTVVTLTERLQQSADQQPLIVRCQFCPDWTFVGTAEKSRTAQLKHREQQHPETLRTRRKQVTKKFAQKNMSAEREAEIHEERRQRMRSLGLG